MAVLAAAMVLPVCAQDSAPASGSAKTAPAAPAAAEQLNPVRDRWARYKSDLSQADRGKWVTELQPQMGLGTEVKEEAQFWYGLNAQKLENERWQQLGRDALAKLVTDGKTVWKTRARNAQIEMLYIAETLDMPKVLFAKKQLEQELIQEPHTVDAVETAVTLARLSRRIDDPATAQKAAQFALNAAKYVDYRGCFSQSDLEALAKETRNLNRIAKTPDAEREFALAEKIKLSGKYEEAIDCYEKVIQKFPQDQLARKSELRICECLFLHQDYLPAKLKLVELLQQDPRGPYRGSMHVVLGDIWLEHDFDLVKAQKEYEAVFFPDAYVLPGEEPKNAPASKPTKVAPAIIVAPPLKVDLQQTTDPLVAVIEAAKDPAKRLAKIKEYMPKDLHETWSEALADGVARRGMLAFLAGDFAGADRCFQDSFLMNPNVGTARLPNKVLLLADFCRRKAQPVEAWALKEGDDKIKVALFMSITFLRIGEYERALQIFKRIDSVEFPYATQQQKWYALDGQAEALFLLDKPTEAFTIWKQFLNGPAAQSYMAPDAIFQLACQTQDPKAFETIYTQYPQSNWVAAALVQHGFLLITQGKNREALPLMQRAAQMKQDAGWALRASHWVEKLKEKIARGGTWTINDEMLARSEPRMRQLLEQKYKLTIDGKPIPEVQPEAPKNAAPVDQERKP